MAINYTEQQNEWNRVFAIKFHNAVLDNPKKYSNYDGQHHSLGEMCAELKDAIYSGDNNYLISDTIKATCKEIGIKATYLSINQYLNS
jgi:hypothetical protein